MRRKDVKWMGLAAMIALGAALGARAEDAAPAAAATPAADAAAAKPAAKAKAMAKPKADADAATTADAKPKKSSNSVTVSVKNSRSAGLTLMTATVSGGDKAQKVAAKLKPGKSTSARLTRGKDCLFDLHADYDDGQSMDETGMDLCKQGKLNLTD